MQQVRKSVIALALVTMVWAGAVQAHDENCLTPEEAKPLFQYALGDALSGAAQSCTPTLGQASFLATGGADMIKRYRDAQSAAWPVARRAIRKAILSSGAHDKSEDLIAKLPDEALQPFVSGMVKQIVASALKPKDCARFDEIAQLLAPLPPENMAGLITLVVELMDRPKPGQKQNLNLCPLQPVTAVLPSPNR